MKKLLLALSLLSTGAFADAYRIGQTTCVTDESGMVEYYITSETCKQVDVLDETSIEYTFEEIAAVRGGYHVNDIEVVDIQFAFENGPYGPSSAVIIYRVSVNKPLPDTHRIGPYHFPKPKEF